MEREKENAARVVFFLSGRFEKCFFFGGLAIPNRKHPDALRNGARSKKLQSSCKFSDFYEVFPKWWPVSSWISWRGPFSAGKSGLVGHIEVWTRDMYTRYTKTYVDHCWSLHVYFADADVPWCSYTWHMISTKNLDTPDHSETPDIRPLLRWWPHCSRLSEGLSAHNFQDMKPIQRKVLPLALGGHEPWQWIVGECGEVKLPVILEASDSRWFQILQHYPTYLYVNGHIKSYIYSSTPLSLSLKLYKNERYIIMYMYMYNYVYTYIYTVYVMYLYIFMSLSPLFFSFFLSVCMSFLSFVRSFSLSLCISIYVFYIYIYIMIYTDHIHSLNISKSISLHIFITCQWNHPPSMATQDVVATAPTGSGKTLAFLVPAMAP